MTVLVFVGIRLPLGTARDISLSGDWQHEQPEQTADDESSSKPHTFPRQRA
jgi:hypothetical protein